MTTSLYIQYGSTTLNLNSGGYTLLDGFFPTAPDEKKNVVDSFSVFIQGASAADLEAKKQAIQNAFTQAKELEHNPAGDRVYLYYQLDSSAVLWRTQITRGSMTSDRSMRALWEARQARVKVGIEHLPFWEGPEAAVSISNANGSGTGGIPVFNCNDGVGAAPAKRQNWIEIAAGAIDGDLPAACRLEITNITNLIMGWIWIGQNWVDPANLIEVLEVEDGTASALIGNTPTLDANASGGAYVSKSLVSGFENDLVTWTVSTAMMNAAKGQHLRAMIYFANFPANSPDIRFRLQIKWNDAVYWEGEQVQPSDLYATMLRDIGVFRLSPGLDGLTGLDGVKLVLTGYQSTGNTITFDLDCLYLVPVNGWRWMLSKGYGIPQNSRIVDDGINEYLYRDDGAGTGKVGIVAGYGRQILLKPAVKQRLYFLYHGVTLYNADINHQISVKLHYRPRQATP